LSEFIGGFSGEIVTSSIISIGVTIDVTASLWYPSAYSLEPVVHNSWHTSNSHPPRSLDLIFDVPQEMQLEESAGWDTWPSASILRSFLLNTSWSGTGLISLFTFLLLLFLCFFLLGRPLQKSRRFCRFKSDHDENWQERSSRIG